MTAPTTFLSGSITALVTPFRRRRARRGGLPRPSSTGRSRAARTASSRWARPGESPTLSHDEHRRVVEMLHRRGAGAGCRSSPAPAPTTRPRRSTSRATPRRPAPTRVLVVTPYYNKPTQEGLYQHFKAVNDAIGIPIIIYNIPPRSVVDMSVDTMARLFELKNIVGVKDATGNVGRVCQQRARHGPGLHPALGRGHDRARLHGGMAATAASRSSSNVAPRLCAELQEACLAGDYAEALQLQDRLMPLHAAIFIEPGRRRREVRALRCSAG